jgi:A/G-specific adenine glycosylase
MTDDSGELLSPAAIAAIRRRVRKWGRENYRPFAWREPKHLWHALIAEVLLQRTRAGNVALVYEKFIARFPEAQDLKTATLEEIETLIYPLGLRWRAPLLKQLCDYLANTDGKVPTTREELLQLPAVGPYVASAML